MTPVRWSQQAADDLEAIHTYIARDSVPYAATMTERILQAIDRLEQFPELGHMVPEFERPDLRELLVGSYRVVYHLDRQTVGLVTIVHGARLLRLPPGAV